MRRRREEPEERGPEVRIDVGGDPLTESVVLASMLAEPSVADDLLRRLPADAFVADEQHKILRDAIGEARRRKLSLDAALLGRLRPDLDVRLPERLQRKRPTVSPDLEHHVGVMAWDRMRVAAADGPVGALLVALQDPATEPERLRAIARQVGQAFAGETGKARHLRRSEDVVSEATRAIRTRAKGETRHDFGITGLDVDEKGARRIRPGVAPGLITILSGKSGSGKSTLAANMILGLRKQRRRVLVGAWEVRAPMTLEMLATIELGWSRSKVLDGRSTQHDATPITDDEVSKLEASMRQIADDVVFVENPFRRGASRGKRSTNEDHLDVLEEHIAASGCDVVVLDLFDRCLRDRRPDDEQEALWRMLDMADDLQVHLVLVHQQLMKGEHVMRDGTPSLSALKGSSAYVDVGVTVLATHVPAQHKQLSGSRVDVFEVHVLKARYARPCIVEFTWDADVGQIKNGRTATKRPEDEEAARGDRKDFHAIRRQRRPTG